MADENVVYASSTTTPGWRGIKIRLIQGEKWEADDAFVKERPEFFTTDVPGARRNPIEQQSAAPGESSLARSPRTSTTAAAKAKEAKAAAKAKAKEAKAKAEA